MLFDDEAKGNRSGFAIGGLTGFKEGESGASFFDVTTDATGIIDPAENRVLWYPKRNSFLTGNVLIESPDSVGVNSFSTGYQSKSIGQYSQAMGYESAARGDYSTAIGKNAVANSDNSFAFGEDARAQGEDSYAIGRGATAEGYRSFAIGSAGVNSEGMHTLPPKAAGDYSFAFGQGARAIAQGAYAMGISANAEGPYSTSLGYGTKSNGEASTAMGYMTFASGGTSIAMGNGTVASGGTSTAMGYSTTASGGASTAMGIMTHSIGQSSTAMGEVTIANTKAMTAIGSYNDFGTNRPDTWEPDDPIFVIGIGLSEALRKNAMTVLKNGKVGLQSVTAPTYALHLPATASDAEGRAQANRWDTYSDTRIKSNQQPIRYGLSEVMRMVPKTYFYHNSTTKDGSINISPDGQQDIGLIAQEMYEIIPEVVSKPENEQVALWGLAYDKLVPVLVKAIQEQQEVIDKQQGMIENQQKLTQEQQSEIDKLKQKNIEIDALRAEIEQLKQLMVK